MTRNNSPSISDRRGFFAAGLAALTGLFPLLAGLGVLLDPLRRKSNEAGRLVRIASLSALPDDGVPRRFDVITDQVNAWNHRANVPVGAVYLRRTGEFSVEAFSVNCPHAGCFVEYRRAKHNYLCPCHNSEFGIDGSIQDPSSPSPRGLDALEVDAEKLRQEQEIWIRYQKFQAGKPEKLAI